MPVLTLPEAKLQLDISDAETSLDDELQDYVDAVDEVLERHTRRTVASREITERHDVRGSAGVLALRRHPVSALASVERADGSRSWDVASLDLDPDNGLVRSLNGDGFAGLVKVTYTAGYVDAEIPHNYKIAARIILQHLWLTQRGTVGAPRTGGMSDSLDNAGYSGGIGYAIPNAALELLGPQPPVFA